jgi:hypothetical protein
VYRIPLVSVGRYYSKDYCVKEVGLVDGYKYGDFFPDRSMFTVQLLDIYGNVNIIFEPSAGFPAKLEHQVTVANLPYLPYYYSPVARYSNLEPPLPGNQTRYFLGFTSTGGIRTSILAAPVNQPVQPVAAPVVIDYGGGYGGDSGGFSDSSSTSTGDAGANAGAPGGGNAAGGDGNSGDGGTGDSSTAT